ncbi:hypothetical protein T492DRAFT_1095454 [Pavlovales sp. CCMP2436]|nr:hypothetical protein T492DRAFT_1095454 [Pavlovales sp. CCMP2436]|mmetsp:Transcript_13768/g.32789  ORF Transcript_13768/g.32789 Transcript_13768/m.32789 type:complete len:453 (+) Transcript_13768:124-1482(+)
MAADPSDSRARARQELREVAMEEHAEVAPTSKLSSSARLEFQQATAKAANEEYAEREALEHGFYYGRVVWFDAYPFDDVLILAPREKLTAAAAAAPAAPQPPARPRQLWRRQISWRVSRLLPDLRFYLRNNHCVASVFLAHPLDGIGRFRRLLLLLAAAGVSLAFQFLLEADVDTTMAETLDEVLSSGTLDASAYPELRTALVASSLTAAISIGAIFITAFHALARLFVLPPCARRAETLEGVRPGQLWKPAAESELAPPVKRGRAAAAAGGGGPTAGGCCRGCSCFSPRCCSRTCTRLAYALSVRWPSVATGLVFATGAAAGGVALGFSKHWQLTCLNALASLVQAALFSVGIDLLLFLAARHQQLRRFGQPDVVRASLYPSGLSRPSVETLRTSQRWYTPLAGGVIERRRDAERGVLRGAAAVRAAVEGAAAARGLAAEVRATPRGAELL